MPQLTAQEAFDSISANIATITSILEILSNRVTALEEANKNKWPEQEYPLLPKYEVE